MSSAMKPAAARRTATIPAQRSPHARPAAAAAVPTSLVKVPDSTRPRCVACGSPRLIEIAMTLTDGTPVTFSSCRHCEHRRWTDGGDVLPVASVLAKATKRTA